MALEFDEASHTYRMGETKLISVTTLLSSWFKKFNPDETIKMMRSKPSWPQSKYFGMTDEDIKTTWSNDGMEASRKGTAMHLQIETYLKTGEEGKSREMEQFMRFAEKEKMDVVGVEYKVFDEEWGLAGTIDCVAEEDGTWTLYDWKRSKDIMTSYGYSIQEGLTHIPSSNYWKYGLQLNLYRALVEKGGKDVGRMCIVCFHEEHLDYQMYEVGRIDVEKILNSRVSKKVCDGSMHG